MEENNQVKKRFISNIPLVVVEVILLCISMGILYVVTLTTSRVEKVDMNIDNIQVNEEVAEKTFFPVAGNKNKKQDPVKATGYRNIALFGVDSRAGDLGAGTRSDSIMICSINQDTNEVSLISVYRDTYLNVGDDVYTKCNAAYAKGGPERAISMLNTNMDLNITDYVTVGFEGLIEAIDALGGVEIDINASEISHLNNYQLCMSEELGIPYTEVYEEGIQNLNGMQATAYCRIRYTKGDDYKRAERQRTVLTAMVEKAKTVSFTKLSSAVVAIMPNIATSLSTTEIISVMSAGTAYEVKESSGFPVEKYRTAGRIGKGDCIIPKTLEDNVKELHLMLYGEENYEPSQTVKEYSRVIKEKTDTYLNQ